MISDFLRDNFIRTNNDDDLMKWSDLNERVQNFLREQGKEQITRQKFDSLVKLTFGEIRNKNIFNITCYSGLKERVLSNDESFEHSFLDGDIL